MCLVGMRKNTKLRENVGDSIIVKGKSNKIVEILGVFEKKRVVWEWVQKNL
jgi:hypothetical protein